MFVVEILKINFSENDVFLQIVIDIILMENG